MPGTVHHSGMHVGVSLSFQLCVSTSTSSSPLPRFAAPEGTSAPWRLLPQNLLELGHVGQILGAGRGALRGDEIVDRE